jgi:molecular chaperone HtpG
MIVAEENRSESRPFEADVAKLLQLIVHSVYSEKSIFLRELISNAADACERLRYEAIAVPALLGDDPKPRITITVDAEERQLMVEDNGVGMSREELIESFGTIARSGTKAFIDRLEAAKSEEETALIGRFGVGFYSAFMASEKVEVFSRRAGSETAHVWSSDGKGAFAVAVAEAAYAPRRGTRVVLHLMPDAKSYTERATIERLVRAQSGHVPVPIAIVEKPGAEVAEITDGAALWAKPKSSITPADYTDFYRSVSGQSDEPALTIHFHAEGRHDYTSLFFVPGARPFDLFDPDRKVASSSTSSASSLPTMRTSCRAICALCAGWSTRPICRSTSRARRFRKARFSAPSEKVPPAACSRNWSGSPTRSRTTTRKSGSCSASSSRRARMRTSSAARRCLCWRASEPPPAAKLGEA